MSSTTSDPRAKEKDALSDTSTSIFRSPRTPTNEAFIPVGHVGLEWKSEANRQLGLPTDGVVWATTLYISFPLRGYGLGRSTMRQVEAAAVRAPVSAGVMVLDTQKGASQMSEEVVKLMYEDRGLPTPSVSGRGRGSLLPYARVLIAWIGAEDERGVVYEAGVSRVRRGGEGVWVGGSYYRRDEVPAEGLFEEGSGVSLLTWGSRQLSRGSPATTILPQDVLHSSNGRVAPRSTSPHRWALSCLRRTDRMSGIDAMRQPCGWLH